MNIKKQFTGWRCLCSALVIFFAAFAHADNLQLLSLRDSSISAPAGGSGDSDTPIISDDDRYVVFASTAQNLTTNRLPNQNFISRINVFVRDRVNSNTTLASASLTGTSGNGDSLPSGISTNGQFILFESTADNLVANDTNGTSDVFLRDLVAQTTTLVSISTNGSSGNGASYGAVMTPDGRYVAFASASSNLVANDQNGIPDIFLRDLQSQTTTLISVGAQPVDYASFSESPQISDNGNYVAFFSMATNFVTDVQTAGEIYVRDVSGANTIWASTNARSIFKSIYGTTNIVCCDEILSADGQTVVFIACTKSTAIGEPRALVLQYSLQTGITAIIHTNASFPNVRPESIQSLDMTPDGRFVTFVANTNTCVFQWDAQTATNVLVNQSLSGDIPLRSFSQTNSACDWPSVTADGRYVAFYCSGTNLATNILSGPHNYYVRDMQAGTTVLLNTDTNGSSAQVNFYDFPVIARQSSLVAFVAPDGALIANDRNRADDVFIRDLLGPVELVSAHAPTLSTLAPGSFGGVSTFSASANGRFVAYTCDADDVVIANTNRWRGVFVRDLLMGTNLLVSARTNGSGLDSFSSEPSISADGRYVAFSSFSSNCIAGDTNKSEDVFVRDLQAGTNLLVSVSTNGGFGDASSYAPQISADGRYVLFFSLAKNLLIPAQGAGSLSLILRDLQLHTNYFVTGTNGYPPSMTPDGRFIASVSFMNFSPPVVYVWDRQSAKRIFTNASGANLVTLSPHGHWLAAVSNSVSTLMLFDLNANTNVSLAHGYFLLRDSMQFSDDERYLVYSTGAALSAADSNNTNDVYLYDTQSGTNQLISRRFGATASPRGRSYQPTISSDGRFIAYTCLATNAAATDSNSVADVFLFDRVSGLNILVSQSRFDGSAANSRSLKCAFSPDGKVLFFRSRASDLTANDFNRSDDLYALFLDSLIITDTDGDGLDDGWEMKWFGTLARGGTGDFDGDGVSDLDEFRAGTDPTDPASAFKAQISADGQEPVVNWPLVVGKSYHVQYKDDLTDSQWQDLTGNQIVVGGKAQIQDADPAVGQRFYRIVLDSIGN